MFITTAKFNSQILFNSTDPDPKPVEEGGNEGDPGGNDDDGGNEGDPGGSRY